jgi:hypothetical protein
MPKHTHNSVKSFNPIKSTTWEHVTLCPTPLITAGAWKDLDLGEIMRMILAKSKNIDLAVYTPGGMEPGSSLEHPKVYWAVQSREGQRAYVFHKGIHYYALVPTFGRHKPSFVQIGEPIPGLPGLPVPKVPTMPLAVQTVGPNAILPEVPTQGKKFGVSTTTAMGIGGVIVAGAFALGAGIWALWGHSLRQSVRQRIQMLMGKDDRGNRTTSRRKHARDIKWESDS